MVKRYSGSIGVIPNMKKSQFRLTYLVSLIGIILIIVTFKFLFLNRIIQSTEINIQSIKEDIKIDNFFSLYLKTPVGDYTITDYIIYYYYTSDGDILEQETDKVLKKMYGEDVKWGLNIENRIIDNYDSPGARIPKKTYVASIPLFPDSDKKMISVTLSIYKK